MFGLEKEAGGTLLLLVGPDVAILNLHRRTEERWTTGPIGLILVASENHCNWLVVSVSLATNGANLTCSINTETQLTD